MEKSVSRTSGVIFLPTKNSYGFRNYRSSLHASHPCGMELGIEADPGSKIGFDYSFAHFNINRH